MSGPRFERDRVLLPDGRALAARQVPAGAWLLDDDERQHLVHVARSRHGTWVHAAGRAWLFAPAHREAAAGASSGVLLAPMTGTVVEVRAAVGDEVAADQPLLVLSAMKMQLEIRTGIAGVVRSVSVKAGDRVEGGTSLLVVEAKS